MRAIQSPSRPGSLINIDHDALAVPFDTPCMPRMTLSSAARRPSAGAIATSPRTQSLRAPPVLRPAALPVAAALAAALAAGQREPAQLAVLGLATLAAATGAFLLPRRIAAGAAVAAASLAAAPILGPRPSLYLLAGALSYGVLYARWLEPHTPFAVVLAGASIGCASLAGWQTAASTVRPTPLLVAAVIFLWTPGHLWSRSIAVERDRLSSASLAAVAGVEQTAAAVFAVAVGVVAASVLLAPRLGWPYAVLAIPAGACLVAATAPLRHRTDMAAAGRAHRCSDLYLAALLAGLALSTL
jgi:4-hydroxybenzoate polyprenyltransferase